MIISRSPTVHLTYCTNIHPGETWDDVQLTLKMVRECLPDDIGISVSYPLPGTGFYEQVKAQLGKKTNWQDSNDLAMLYQGPYSQEFYRLLHRRVHHEFRLRRAWLALQRDALHPARWRARHLRLAASLPYQWAGVARTQARLQEWAK